MEQEKKYQEICHAISRLRPKINILFAGAPLGVNNVGHGYSLKEWKEAVEAYDEINRLEEELNKL